MVFLQTQCYSNTTHYLDMETLHWEFLRTKVSKNVTFQAVSMKIKSEFITNTKSSKYTLHKHSNMNTDIVSMKDTRFHIFPTKM